MPFAFKLAATLATVVGAGAVACGPATPGRGLGLVVLLPAVLLLVGRGVTDRSGPSPFDVCVKAFSN